MDHTLGLTVARDTCHPPASVQGRVAGCLLTTEQFDDTLSVCYDAPPHVKYFPALVDAMSARLEARFDRLGCRIIIVTGATNSDFGCQGELDGGVVR
eukprot:5465828-Pyramimonas_sp.AAC.1